MQQTGSFVSAWPRQGKRHHIPYKALVFAFMACFCWAQQSAKGQQTPAPSQQPSVAQAGTNTSQQIKVNWLYGAYVPKDVKLESLDGGERVSLWVRATFTTYGIYFKTALFSISDQIQDRPPAWGDGWAGYGKRVASRQGQFVIQNSLSALGNGLVGYEPRYNRCQCDGFWPRTGHAVARNFVTYDRTETKLRLQFPLYAAAFGAGVVAGSWTPNHDLLTTGGRSALSQVGFGIMANFVGEFWPQIERVWKRKKSGNTPPANTTPAKNVLFMAKEAGN
jgi:hypothetical protein